MGKTRDLFKKTGDSKQTFYVKMGTIKDRNSKTLTEAEQIKKRWQKHTEGKYKKSLNDPDNHDVWSLTENQTWNNRLVPIRKKRTTSLYIVTLLI